MTTETIRTKEQVLEDLGKAYNSGDMKAVSKLAAEVAKFDAAEEKTKRDEMSKKLEATTSQVKGIFDQIKSMLTSGNKPDSDAVKSFANSLRQLTGKELDGADGIWYAADFGEASTGCKVMKTAKKASGGGAHRSYVSNPRKTEDLLKEFGNLPYTTDEKTMKIDKVDTIIPAGTTFQQAYDLSTNGNWRYGLRMAMLKQLETK